MITVLHGVLSPMETITCPDVTYTALAGGKLNCATLGISIAKFLLVHWVTKELHPIVLQFGVATLSYEHPCLSARVDSCKLPGMSMSQATSNLATLCSWFSR